MADAHLVADDLAGAARLAGEGLAVADEMGERVFVAELLRVRGVALDDAGSLSAAAGLAAEQGAHLLRVRVTAAG